MCGRGGEGEDLAQETLLQAFRRIGTFATGTDFRAWLLTIAYHTWVHSARKKKPVVGVLQEGLAEIPAPDPPASGTDLEAAVRSVLGTLPEDQRTVVLLRFGEGLSHAEIASLTGAQASTVRWRLFRARQVLQKALKAWRPAPEERET
jgi:RNA polymerase sigma-70 factor (ECF subfamily)